MQSTARDSRLSAPDCKVFSVNFWLLLEKRCYPNWYIKEGSRNLRLLRSGGENKKGPLSDQRPLIKIIFRSYDNPHTICQNLPETAVTPAEAEETQREEFTLPAEARRA